MRQNPISHNFMINDRLTHTIFGKGTVIGFHNNISSIIIDFDIHGYKELQLAFAIKKLTKIFDKKS